MSRSGREGSINDAVSRPLSLMEVFEKACPYYMSYGMTYDEFWNGDVSAHAMYREANKLRIKDANTLAWLQGRYFYDALVMCAPILRSFTKATRPHDYHKEPFNLFEEDVERAEERKERERYERIKRNVEMFARNHDNKSAVNAGKGVANG